MEQKRLLNVWSTIVFVIAYILPIVLIPDTILVYIHYLHSYCACANNGLLPFTLTNLSILLLLDAISRSIFFLSSSYTLSSFHRLSTTNIFKQALLQAVIVKTLSSESVHLQSHLFKMFSIDKFFKKEESSGKGYIILNVIRVLNIIALLTIVAASWVMLVMTVKTSSVSSTAQLLVLNTDVE